MTGKPTTRKMSDKHEKFLADLLGDEAKIMPNSGAGWAKQMDVRVSHTDKEFAFAIDGKSTFAASVGVTREMWKKAIEQAHNERPALALRWYLDYALTPALDLVVISADDFAELLERANK